MKIRKALTDDIESLAKLFDDYRTFYGKETDFEGAKKFLFDRITNGESEIFVAENSESELVGFVQLYPIFSSTKMKRLWLLNDLFVDLTYRGQGISILLIDRAKKHCKDTGACRLTLETTKSNEVGNKLYPKMGFILDSEHNFYSWQA